MRHWLPIFLVLLLAHCSCQRQDTADTPVIAVDAELARSEGTTPPPDDATQAQARRATAAAAEQAASTLHAYMGLLPRADRSAADDLWSGASPGAPAGDAVLRAIPGLRGMKIQNDPPKALDRESPPRAFEIPVRLRLDTESGPRQLRGWYRLRARIDGQGWEITSASLDPVLD